MRLKITVVMVVRDEEHVLPVSLRYHRARGVDEILVVDNGSSDGTRGVLRRMARRDPAVRWSSESGPFHQGEIFTALARDAAARGSDWVLPTDADEFWWTKGSLRAFLMRRLREPEVGALRTELVHFVQDRRVEDDSPLALRSMRWRLDGYVDEPVARPLVMSDQLSFLSMRYPPKYAIRATAHTTIHAGNHHVEGLSGRAHATNELVIMHAPMRARGQLLARAEVGRRVGEVAHDPDQGWHARRLLHLAETGRLNTEWLACSVADESVVVSDARVPVVRDDRLRRATRRFVTA
jgi:hypothetical protein